MPYKKKFSKKSRKKSIIKNSVIKKITDPLRTPWQQNQRRRGHRVGIVNEYAETALSHHQRLHGHDVREVNKYADTDGNVLLFKKKKTGTVHCTVDT